MAEELVTVFKLETAEFDKKLADATKGMEGYDKTTDEATKANGAYANSLGNVSQKAQTYRTVVQAAAKSTGDLSKETAKVGQSTGLIGKLSGAWSSVKSSVASAGTGIKSFFSGIVQGASSAVPGLGSIAGGFGGMLGPIGLAATAVVGFISNFSRLDSVKVLMDGLSIQFDTLLNRLTSFEGFVGLFNPAEQARDAAFAEAIAKRMDEIEEATNRVNVANAEAGVLLAGLNQQLRDRTKSEEDRLAIADEITKVERARAAEEIRLIQQRIQAETIRAKLQLRSLGEVSDEQKKALADLEVELRNSQASTIQLTETVERRRNSIVEQGAEERTAAAQKEAAEQERINKEAAQKREAEARAAEQLATQTAQAQGRVLEIQRSANREKELESLSSFEREEAILQEGYAKQVEAARKAFAELRKLAPEGPEGDTTRAQIASQEADTIATIEANLNTQLGELQDERLEKVRQGILTESEIKREAINKDFDARRLAAEQAITDQEELNAYLLTLEQNRRAALAEVVDEDEAKRIEKLRADQQARLDIITSTGDQIAGVVQGFTSGQIENGKEAAKALAQIALDSLEKLVNIKIAEATVTALASPDSVATGGASGVVKALVIAGLIKAAFAAVRGLIAGAYTGERNIGSGGEQPIWSGRDGYLRRVHKGEWITPADKAKKYEDVMHMIHDDTLGDIKPTYQSLFVGQGRAELRTLEYVTSLGAVNQYVEGSHITNHYSTASGSVPEFDDGRIVGALGSVSSAREQRKQTALLQQLSAKQRGQNKRYR